MKFYCDWCRAEFAKQKQEVQQEFIDSAPDSAPVVPAAAAPALTPAVMANGPEPGQRMTGVIYDKKEQRGFGFIRAEDNKEYFFHLTDLQPGLEFEQVQRGLPVTFEVKRPPLNNRAGAAQNVQRSDPISNRTGESS
jgi:cold shock CspA family protein